jgi:aspartyl-tRNA(Asn)/glutamyl-tRNA(Gln) amidotransferase subunit A
MPELWELSAAELIDLYASRIVSPVEVVSAVMDRIDQLNPKLHAYLATNPNVLDEAKWAEQVWLRSGYKPPLCGVPMSVKDNLDVGGMPTTYGSLAFKDNVRPDSEIARRIRRAGGVILGKTNLPEFAMADFVDNKLGEKGANPWDLERTCGGSSGGAGAAVAAGLGPIAIGTDSSGSIRYPAAYNGVFGLKPSMQRLPMVQRFRASTTRSVNGPITRTVHDAWLTMHALAGPHPYDPASTRWSTVSAPPSSPPVSLGRRRVGIICTTSGLSASSAEYVSTAISDLSNLLLDLDLDVDDQPINFPAFTETESALGVAKGEYSRPYGGDVLAAAEDLIPDFLIKHGDELTSYAGRGLRWAAESLPAYRYRNFLKAIDRYVGHMHDAIGEYDFVITPLTDVAPRIADQSKSPSFPLVGCFNYSHQPVGAVPVGLSQEGLPLSIQVVGRLGDDEGVLSVCAAIEAQRPWQARWPSIN